MPAACFWRPQRAHLAWPYQAMPNLPEFSIFHKELPPCSAPLPNRFSVRPTTATSSRSLKIVDKINAFEPQISPTVRRRTCARRRRSSASGWQRARRSTTSCPKPSPPCARHRSRTLGMRHFDVQMVGGIVLHRGEIAEMRTGEGKTLVATLACYLNAIEGKGVHVVTVNDYLAARDAEWMGQVYRFLGLTVGVIVPNLGEAQRREAYAADITYATNNELGFDYLRDNMKHERSQMVQRPFNFAIVDEVDSILIDEARTPLIISGPTDDKSELYIAVDAIVLKLDDEDYEKDEKTKLGHPDRGRHREGRADARGRRAAGRQQPLRCREHADRPPPRPGAQGQRDVQARHRLHRQGRQDRHHRRVHRPHDGWPPLVERPAPGGRGQGRRADRAREPDDGLDHLPELFPHVSQAVGHDRHRRDRSGRILRHLQDERRHHPDQRARSAASTRRTSSTRTPPTSSRRSPRRSARRT